MKYSPLIKVPFETKVVKKKEKPSLSLLDFSYFLKEKKKLREEEETIRKGKIDSGYLKKVKALVKVSSRNLSFVDFSAIEQKKAGEPKVRMKKVMYKKICKIHPRTNSGALVIPRENLPFNSYANKRARSLVQLKSH